MLPGSPHLYVKQAMVPRGTKRKMTPAPSHRLLQHGVATVEKVHPSIFPLMTLGDLAYRSGVSYDFLRAVVERRIHPYRPVAQTMTAKARPIVAPEPLLMRVHRWLNSRVLNLVPVHANSHAYVPGRSVIACAARHSSCSWMLKSDIHSYFSSIDERDVYRVFRRLGYQPLLAFELSRLCTISPGLTSNTKSKYKEIPSYHQRLVGTLPQGAPTSGMLANLASEELDRRLSQWALDKNYVYTRYSDDITLSSARPFDRAEAETDLDDLKTIIRSCSLRPHDGKSRIVSPGARKIVLGLLVDGPSPRLTVESRRRLDEHIRCTAKFGLHAHSSSRGFKSTIGFVRHIEGHLAFAAGVEPSWADVRRERWSRALQGDAIWGSLQ